MPITTRQQLRKGPTYRQDGRKQLDDSIDSGCSLPYGYEDEDDRTIVIENGGGVAYRKGTQQDETMTDDLHLSIEEVTATGDKSQFTVIGTSFLDRPWQPPMDTTTESGESLVGNDEVIGCGINNNDISSNGITRSRSHLANSANRTQDTHLSIDRNPHQNDRPGRTRTRGNPEEPIVSQSPAGKLPTCSACKKSILGKYYEKDGLAVHVECFRDFLKDSKKSQNSTIRSSSKRSRSGGRKSPHPRRAPPVPVKRDPILQSNEVVGSKRGSFSPDVRDRGPSSGSVDAPYRNAAPSMGPYLPRDSDGSGSWLAHPSSLEPYQNRSDGQLPKPLSPPNNVPTNVPSTTVNNLRSVSGSSNNNINSTRTATNNNTANGNTRAINQNISLTLSPEGKTTRGQDADELLIGNISPIKELEEAAVMNTNKETTQSPHQNQHVRTSALEQPNPYDMSDMYPQQPDLMEGPVVEQKEEPADEMSACSFTSSISESPYGGENLPRVSEGTPIQQRVMYNSNTNRSTPPSKALSTKLESPATPTPGSEHSMGGSLLFDDIRNSGAKAPVDVLLSGGSPGSAWVPIERSSNPPVENAPLEISMVSQGVVTDSPPRNIKTRYRASVAGSFTEEIERVPTPRDVIVTRSGSARRSVPKSLSPPLIPQHQPNMAALLLEKTPPVKPKKQPTAVPVEVVPKKQPVPAPAEVAPKKKPTVAKKTANQTNKISTNEAILGAEIAKYRLMAETASLREDEMQGRLNIISEQMEQTPDWMNETSRILKELISAKVELATLKTNTNPLSAIRLIASDQLTHPVPPPAIAKPKAGWSPPTAKSSPGGKSPPFVKSPTGYKCAPDTPQKSVPGPNLPMNSLTVNNEGVGLHINGTKQTKKGNSWKNMVSRKKQT